MAFQRAASVETDPLPSRRLPFQAADPNVSSFFAPFVQP